MQPNDPTTPLAGMVSHEQPTIQRPASDAPRAEAGLTPGTIVGERYRIVALLGRGGMGEVYRADDLRLGQTVALKFLDLDSDTRSVEHLYHEVRVARQVSHPNVCRVHDVVEAGGHRFIAMEYVDGEDLASLLRRIGRLPASKATDVARDIASGLAAAHDRGIIHRDLKPANVMIDGSGRARVTDFGLASVAGTHDGRIAGTPAYMAPEQVAGKTVTTRSDVYALGLLIHELFTGERVYASISSYAERQRQSPIRPRAASSSVKEVDPAIDALVAACLAEDPAMRPASAREVVRMLPGGDAIDAAMAAGETPSPEMVAAAAETGVLTVPVAATVFGFIVIGLFLLAWQRSASLISLIRKPPDVLVDRAEAIVGIAGETAPVRDSVYFFDADRGLLRHRWGRVPQEQFAAIRPGVMRFIYRRAAERMAPRETIQVANDVFIFSSGRVTVTDPPLDVPGSAVVMLDHRGALVNYLARPSGRSPVPDWKPMLEATGIDMNSLAPATSVEVPPVATDARVAWSAAFAGQPERVRIEAASLNGKPAWLHVFPVWETGKRAPSSAGGQFIQFARLLITLLFTIIAIVATRRSLRRGRGDRSGAIRFATYIGALMFLSWFIAAHHAIDAEDQARMLSAGLGSSVGSAIIVWVFYIALEPGVRRTWPRSLIGWSRLVAGKFRDPMVGREILFGIAGGLLSYGFFWASAAVRTWSGHPAGFLTNADAIDPLRIYIGNALISHTQMIEIPIGMIFGALMFRKAFGTKGAMAVGALLLGGYALVSPGVSLFIALLIFAMLRFGLLTGVAIGASVGILGSAPLTLDMGAWYWPRAAAVLLFVALAAAWAAWTASLNQSSTDPARLVR